MAMLQVSNATRETLSELTSSLMRIHAIEGLLLVALPDLDRPTCRPRYNNAVEVVRGRSPKTITLEARREIS